MLKNTSIYEILSDMADPGYKEFHSRLIPNILQDKILGIRTPVLRKFARDFYKNPRSHMFMNSLPHSYYEEDNLHAFLTEQITDIDKAIEETERFLPYINNWATCDSFFPKVFKKHPELIEKKALYWIKSEHCYTKRYGIGILMKMFLDDKFKMKYPEIVSEIRSDEYYVNMMIAWYFATAITKRYEECIVFLEEKRLDRWVHNKTISKCCDSLQITPYRKKYLKSLRLV